MKKILIVILAAMLLCTGCSGGSSKGETGMSTSGNNSPLQSSEAVSESKVQNSANENEGQTATESSTQKRWRNGKR